MTDLTNYDFARHNEEQKALWDAYRKGNPPRVPMIVGCNVRMLILDKKLNDRNVTFRDYSEDPDIMLETNLKFQKWLRFNLLHDGELGLPPEGWGVQVDFQNYYEAAWFGCPVFYREGQVPDTEPILAGDKKNLLFDRGIPDPFGGLMKKNLEYYLYFREKQKQGYSYEGLPIKSVSPSGMGTDGALTLATNLRGVEIYTDIYEDPAYVEKLFDFIIQATVLRLKAWAKYLGWKEKNQGMFFADDSVQNISLDTYKTVVMPFHKKMLGELTLGGPNNIHLCGDSTRHFRTLRDELNVRMFDTGFPVDFGWLRKELGEDVEIYGGPNVNLLLSGSEEEVRNETKRILSSGIMKGGKFVLRDGNNLAPRTPARNITAMYEAVKEYGKY